MKKTTYLLAGALALGVFSSCGSDATKTEASEAQEVQKIETESSKTLSEVAEGSHIYWRGTHLGGTGERFGKAFIKEAEVVVDGDKVVNAKAVIDMTSFTVENFGDDTASTNKLTGHLHTADFFNTAEFPTASFELTGIEAAEGEYNSKVTGNLTIKGIAKSITFAANVTPSADMVDVKSEQFSVDRREWGIVYNVEGTEGVPADYIISNELEFKIDFSVK